MRFLALAAASLGLLATVSCTGHVHVASRPAGPPAVRPAPHRAVHPAHLGVPPGHLPPPGQCRVWIPGRPPGHQPRPGACSTLARTVPAGAWLLYRPSGDRKHVELTVYDAVRPKVVVSVGIYDAGSGSFVREGRAAATR